MNKLNVLFYLAMPLFVSIGTSATGGSHENTMGMQNQPLNNRERFQKLRKSNSFLFANIRELNKYTQLISDNLEKSEMRREVYKNIKIVRNILNSINNLDYNLKKQAIVINAINNAKKVLKEARNYFFKESPFPKFPDFPEFPVQP